MDFSTPELDEATAALTRGLSDWAQEAAGRQSSSLGIPGV